MDMCLVRVIHYVLSFGNGLKRYLRELLADDQEVGFIVFRSVQSVKSIGAIKQVATKTMSRDGDARQFTRYNT